MTTEREAREMATQWVVRWEAGSDWIAPWQR